MSAISEPCAFGDDFTTEHALRMLDFYGKTLQSLGYGPVAYEDVDAHVGSAKLETPKYDTLCHAHWMVNKTREFLQHGRVAKAYRWIGTIQGILWMNGVFSIMELKEHNRFDLPPVRARS